MNAQAMAVRLRRYDPYKGADFSDFVRVGLLGEPAFECIMPTGVDGGSDNRNGLVNVVAGDGCGVMDGLVPDLDATWLAEFEQRTVGVMRWCAASGGAVELTLLRVSPDWLETGLGQRLFEFAVQEFRKQGYSDIRVRTH